MLSASIAVYRPQAECFGGRSDGNFGVSSVEASYFRVLRRTRLQDNGVLTSTGARVVPGPEEDSFGWIRGPVRRGRCRKKGDLRLPKSPIREQWSPEVALDKYYPRLVIDNVDIGGLLGKLGDQEYPGDLGRCAYALCDGPHLATELLFGLPQVVVDLHAIPEFRRRAE
jgi:hypothetical protein